MIVDLLRLEMFTEDNINEAQICTWTNHGYIKTQSLLDIAVSTLDPELVETLLDIYDAKPDGVLLMQLQDFEESHDYYTHSKSLSAKATSRLLMTCSSTERTQQWD
jgi:hypothetical protein